MTHLAHKADGAVAAACVLQEDFAVWRASLVVRSRARDFEQLRGPKTFQSKLATCEWVFREAARHGFEERDVVVAVEALD